MIAVLESKVCIYDIAGELPGFPSIYPDFHTHHWF